ncbi:MAG TPA: type II toxin-antitoxin system RatA family toxin [Casimicrobiaceae bacterium]|nr:type II toxin-antitoxin system RatA family toxin [Casimicrobiaceae bacterium]
MQVNRCALVEQPASRMFDLIEAVEHYPEFVPWCVHTTVLARDLDSIAARIRVGYRGITLEFTTRNRKMRPRWMSIDSDDGPFRHFRGEWHLTELGPTACRIDFELSYEFIPGLAALTAPVMHHVATNLVHAFVQRAEGTRAAFDPANDSPVEAST